MITVPGACGPQVVGDGTVAVPVDAPPELEARFGAALIRPWRRYTAVKGDVDVDERSVSMADGLVRSPFTAVMRSLCCDTDPKTGGSMTSVIVNRVVGDASGGCEGLADEPGATRYENVFVSCASGHGG